MLSKLSFLRFVWKGEDTNYTEFFESGSDGGFRNGADDEHLNLFRDGATLEDVYNDVKEELDGAPHLDAVQIGCFVFRPSRMSGGVCLKNFQLNLYTYDSSGNKNGGIDAVYQNQPCYFEYPRLNIPKDICKLTYNDVLGIITRVKHTGIPRHRRTIPSLCKIASEFHRDPHLIGRYRGAISEWISYAMAEYVYQHNVGEYYEDHVSFNALFEYGWGANWLDHDFTQDEACTVLRLLYMESGFEGSSLSDFARESIYQYASAEDCDRADTYYREMLNNHIFF